MNIRIIGYGRLAKAITKQWIKHYALTVSSPSQIHQCLENGIQTRNSNLSDLAHSDVIVLAIKPGLIQQVLEEILASLPKDPLIISLAAGITLNQLKESLPKGAQVVRAMPNVNAQFQASATLLLKEDCLNNKKKQWVEELFLNLGSIYWVENDFQLDIGTIIAGSGPAYVFYLMDAFQKVAIDLGLSKDLSHQLITQTFLGSSQAASIENAPFHDMMSQVISPKGTTGAALEVLEKKQLHRHIHDAIMAAWQRVLSMR